MKSLALIVFVVLCGVVYCKPAQKYTTKYDYLDISAILRNDRLMRQYLDCMLDKKNCTKDGAELKKHIPEALRTDCVKCNEIQRNASRTVLKHLIQNRRDWFSELEAKYDPNHIFRIKYDAEIKKEGLHL